MKKHNKTRKIFKTINFLKMLTVNRTIAKEFTIT